VSEESSGGLAGVARKIVDFRRGEGAAVLLSCAFFFLLLMSYYVLRPVRDQLGVAVGEMELLWNFVCTLVAMLLANPLYAWIVTRWPRRRFLPFVYRFFIANLVLFFAVLKFAPPEWQRAMSRVFFVWVSVFNLFVVAVFWSLLVDLFSLEQGKRLFGVVSVGGSLGAISGSFLASLLARPFGPVNLLLISAALLEVSVWTMKALTRGSRIDSDTGARPVRTAGGPPRTLEELDQGGVLNGIALVFRSPYLAWICIYMLFGSVAGTILYFEQAGVLRAAIADKAEQTVFLAHIDLFVNLGALSVQLFLTGRIVRWLGIGPTLAIQCTVFGVALVLLAISPVLGIVALAMVLFRTGHYATSRPAREALFTVVGREAKYKSKGFIDTFVYRFGDALGALLKVGLGRIGGLDTHGIALASLPIAGAWAAVGLVLGRRQKMLIRSQAGAAALPAAPLVR